MKLGEGGWEGNAAGMGSIVCPGGRCWAGGGCCPKGLGLVWSRLVVLLFGEDAACREGGSLPPKAWLGPGCGGLLFGSRCSEGAESLSYTSGGAGTQRPWWVGLERAAVLVKMSSTGGSPAANSWSWIWVTQGREPEPALGGQET